MSEADNSFTKVTPGRAKKTNIVTPNTIPRYLQSELSAWTTLFQEPIPDKEDDDWDNCSMGGSARNFIQVQNLLPERKPITKPTTKDVITLKGNLSLH